ncbi:hypothetical protein BH20CHL1_BH20CHL1_05620 [soil metagenome]|nr:hypothetical protein [Chloroflexia bacterium]
MRGKLSEPARAVLRTMVDSHNHQPRGRFTLSKGISRRGTFRISHPECNISVFPDVFDELIEQRFLVVASDEPGFQVLEITLRGFDFDAHMEQPVV